MLLFYRWYTNNSLGWGINWVHSEHKSPHTLWVNSFRLLFIDYFCTSRSLEGRHSKSLEIDTCHEEEEEGGRLLIFSHGCSSSLFSFSQSGKDGGQQRFSNFVKPWIKSLQLPFYQDAGEGRQSVQIFGSQTHQMQIFCKHWQFSLPIIITIPACSCSKNRDFSIWVKSVPGSSCLEERPTPTLTSWERKSIFGRGRKNTKGKKEKHLSVA